jgi:trehalose-6-phosphate synthase
MPPAISPPSSLTNLALETQTETEIALPNVSVISYSGPGSHGGLPASLSPMVKRLNTRVNWFALTDVPDNDFSPKAQSAASGFTFHHPRVPAWLVADHKRFCQEYLSPLMHGSAAPDAFSPDLWKSFRQLNELVASHCLMANSQSFPSLFWLHDYQLVLASPLLSSQAGLVLCQFWHVPWPEAELIIESPCGKDLTSALLQNRLVGFHVRQYAVNFLKCVEHFYPRATVDFQNLTVDLQGRTTQITVMPLGIDVPYWQKLATQARPQAGAIATNMGLASQIILGVDRLEPSKGLLERLAGIEYMLEHFPQTQKRFHFVQIAEPVKQASGLLSDYQAQVESKIKAINQKYAQGTWSPIVYINQTLSQSSLAAWYQACDVLSVNSIADGLNLIAKEFVASRLDEQGVLVLSQNAGVVSELARGALLVEPTNAEHVGKALYSALTFDSEEKRRRMLLMRHVISWNQLHDWALGFLRKAILA